MTAHSVELYTAAELAQAAKPGDTVTWPLGRHPFGGDADFAERYHADLERELTGRRLRLRGLTIESVDSPQGPTQMEAQPAVWHGGFTPFSTSGAVEWDAGFSCDVLVNLTPHPVTVDFGSQQKITIPSHGKARLETEEVPTERAELADWVPDCLVPVSAPAVRYGRVDGDLPSALPDGLHYTVPFAQAAPGLFQRREGPRVWFVVSTLTALALRGQRKDVLAPGPEIRDTDGRIVACRGLVRVLA